MANSKSVTHCENCGQLFCIECSDSVFLDYCSKECEKEHAKYLEEEKKR